MNHRREGKTMAILIGVLLAVALAAALGVVIRTDVFGEKGPGLGKEFEFDISNIRKIDPELIHYEQVGAFPTGFATARGIATDSRDRIHVAGDRRLAVFSKEGEEVTAIPVTLPPLCLAVAEDGAVYVGMEDHVEVFDRDGKQIGKWTSLGKKALLTSIAVKEGHVFVADYGNRLVVHYDTSGNELGRIGGKGQGKGAPTFVVPSPYFDVTFAPDNLLRIANPGRRRVEAWTLEGQREFYWGVASQGVEGFAGCCNPSHIAIFPDGRIVTSEKGVMRVKVYKADRGVGENGVLESVVAGAETLCRQGTAAGPEVYCTENIGLDVAVDSTGRVLVLDAPNRSVRIFVRKKMEGRITRETAQ